MPKNRLIYVGVLVIAAVAIIFLANEFTKFVMPILPWAGGAGVLLILGGIVWEAKKGSKGVEGQIAHSLKPGEHEAQNIKETVV